jgi:hypothetical protein
MIYFFRLQNYCSFFPYSVFFFRLFSQAPSSVAFLPPRRKLGLLVVLSTYVCPGPSTSTVFPGPIVLLVLSSRIQFCCHVCYEPSSIATYSISYWIQFRYPAISLFSLTEFHWLVASHGPISLSYFFWRTQFRYLVSSDGPSSVILRLLRRTQFRYAPSLQTDPVPLPSVFWRTQFLYPPSLQTDPVPLPVVSSDGPSSFTLRLFRRTQFRYLVSSDGPVPLPSIFWRTQFR